MTRRERLERKQEKREEWAESRDAKSEAAYGRAEEIASGIPFGQPILVGHHSERHARRDQARIESGMIAGHENAKAAADHRAKADGLARQLATSVFSDDEDAIERLTEQVAELEQERERMKAANAEYRREHKAELAAMGAYDRSQAVPYASYSLTNLGARIRSKRERIEEITRERAATEAGVRTGGRVMLARYGGTCADCGGEIERGTTITWYRATKEAVHATCPAREQDALERIADRIEAGELIADKSCSDRDFLAPLLAEPSGHGPAHFNAQNGDFEPPPDAEHACDARPVEEGGDLAYLGDYGAPGIGQAWECGVCGRGFSKIGGAFVEASAGAHLLEPGDVV